MVNVSPHTVQIAFVGCIFPIESLFYRINRHLLAISPQGLRNIYDLALSEKKFPTNEKCSRSNNDLVWEDHFFEGLITRMCAKPFRAFAPAPPLFVVGARPRFPRTKKPLVWGMGFGSVLSHRERGQVGKKRSSPPELLL